VTAARPPGLSVFIRDVAIPEKGVSRARRKRSKCRLDPREEPPRVWPVAVEHGFTAPELIAIELAQSLILDG